LNGLKSKSSERKDCVAGKYFSFWMFLEEGVDWSLDFYLGQVCAGKMCHVKRKGKKIGAEINCGRPFQ
jgi:hypothetical protein